ncbi:hypothetical protein ACFQFS_02585 [Novosphingobium lubricantis]
MASNSSAAGNGSSRPQRRGIFRWLPFALCFLLVAIPAWHSLKREGWFPHSGPDLPFPETGSVTVSSAVNPVSASARMAVTTSNANAVVQLFEPRSGRHVISVYVRKNDHATVAVPPGTYQMKVAEGQRWYGQKAFFGFSATYETVTLPMTFTRGRGNGIDLRRRPDGTLPMRPNWRAPSPI